MLTWIDGLLSGIGGPIIFLGVVTKTYFRAFGRLPEIYDNPGALYFACIFF